MTSGTLLDIAACPDCRGRLEQTDHAVRCAACGRQFEAVLGALDLRPLAAFAEQTKYLDEALHADGRHETIAPPLLGAWIRNDMLRRDLGLAPGDRVVDLGCGNGRWIAWNLSSGASFTGIDVSPHFAAGVLGNADLVLGDLRRLPFQSSAFDKAWSLDVLEHLSRQSLDDVLDEAARVLKPGGQFFVYTHVRKNGWIAGGVRAVNHLAAALERVGLIDLRQERLRKSDHVNPIADHDDLRRIVTAHGFRIERITYYTPVIGALFENVLARLVERWLTRRTARAAAGGGGDEASVARHVRTSVQVRVGRGGLPYKLLRWTSVVMRLDIALFGRIRSGPFFALLTRSPASDDRRANGRTGP